MTILARIGPRSRRAASPVRRVDDAEWSRVLATSADADYRQTPAFAHATAARHGAEVEHNLISDGAEVIGGACVRIRHAPLIGGVAYVAGGPIVLGTADPRDRAARIATCLSALRAEYAARRGLLLRVRPRVPAPDERDTWIVALERAGFTERAVPGGERTVLLDVRRPLREIRRNLRQKWRNGLNRAEREYARGAYTVETGGDAALMDAFVHLHEHLLIRKGFTAELDASFHAGVHEQLDADLKYRVQIARIGAQPVAGHVAAIVGNRTVYVLGASTPAGHAVRAAYRLQWQAIVDATSRGAAWYDLGGIDAEANPGVCHFKRGLGGLDVVEPGPFEAARSAVTAHLVRQGERMFRAMRRAA